MEYAHKLFGNIPQPDIFLFNTMARGYSRSNSPIQAIPSFFSFFHFASCLMMSDDYTFPYVLKACSSAKPLKKYLAILGISKDFDFFYFVQEWPGSYCDSDKSSCCYPTTGKPAADFGIHGLWPNYNNGSYPQSCDPNNPFDESKISDLISSMRMNWPSLACPSSSGEDFWSHEWEKHGTCSESVLDQHAYFQTTLSLRQQTKILQSLKTAGINPDGGSYSLENIKDAIEKGTGYTPWIQCNEDSSGNSQLYQVYLCVDSSGSNLIECPVFPNGKCGSEIEFPTF